MFAASRVSAVTTALADGSRFAGSFSSNTHDHATKSCGNVAGADRLVLVARRYA